MKDKELDLKMKETIANRLGKIDEADDDHEALAQVTELYKIRQESKTAMKQRVLDYTKIAAEIGIAALGAVVTWKSVVTGYKLEYIDDKFPSTTTLKSTMSKAMNFFGKK